jgi:hypothetical protein
VAIKAHMTFLTIEDMDELVQWSVPCGLKQDWKGWKVQNQCHASFAFDS